jgi:adenylate cyclase class 2
MAIEYEATYLNVDKKKFREKLKEIGAILIRSEYLQKRYSFNLESFGRNFWEWVRVRDEGDKITMAYKCIPVESSIEDQKEVELEISDMNLGVEFMKNLGARMTNYSENLRERWILNGVEIDIDTWPYLESYVEVEGKNKEEVMNVSKILDFDFNKAEFCGVGKIYEMKYGVHPDKISKNRVIQLTFDGINPFLK